MSEHYTRNTIASETWGAGWCDSCQRVTRHQLTNGNRGQCLEHERAALTKKQIRDRERRAIEEKNPTLWGGM